MNKKVKRLLAIIVAAVTASTTLAFSSLSASAINTISNPINYIGYVNFKDESYSGGFNYTNYVRMAESYDTRAVSFDGVVAGAWASSTPSTTTVMDTGSLWATTLTFANFNPSSTSYANIYRLKFTRTSTAFDINNDLQDPIIVLAKINGSQVDIEDFTLRFAFTRVALGDVDYDGDLDQDDLGMIYDHYSTPNAELDDEGQVAADIDFNGVVNSADYTLLYNLLNGTISSLW